MVDLDKFVRTICKDIVVAQVPVSRYLVNVNCQNFVEDDGHTTYMPAEELDPMRDRFRLKSAHEGG